MTSCDNRCCNEGLTADADCSLCPANPQMLQQGFDCEQADYDGRTALMLAAAKGHAGIARLLLSAQADVRADSWGFIDSKS